ncbi:MAG: hypothetical protein ACRDOJ_01355, partial [Nocardioidaceae bacterium]
LQTFTILAASPFVFILIGLCVALYADLRRDPLRERRVGPVRGHVPVEAPYAPFADGSPTGGGNGGPSPEREPEPAGVGAAENRGTSSGGVLGRMRSALRGST